jgi:hypothetical protein
MIKKFIFTALLLVGVLACSEDFTEHPAVGALSEEALNNEQGVNLLLTGAYSTLDGQRKNPGPSDWAATADNWWFDVLADDAHKGSTDGDQADLFLLEIYDWQTGNPYLIGKWLALYAGVNRANAVITFISNLEEGDYSSQLTEARFLRGHFNFELQKIWGNVPYISEENYATQEFNQPNSGSIWSQIEADFDYAVSNLPSTQAEVGRPTSWAAKALLGRVYLQQSKWADALSIFNGVINSGPYALMDEYGDNFRLAGDNSSESIFAIQFTADDGQSFNGNRGGTLNFPGGGPFGSCCGFYQPTQDLVNAYQTDANGLPLLDTFNQTDVANDYGIASAEPFTLHTGTLDPRLDFTVGRRGIDYNGWGVNVGKDWIRSSFADISGPYLPKKNIYHAGEDGNRGTGGWGQQRSGINYHIMRYADLLLMAAEAAVETGDITTALDYVNRVRNRAKNMTYVQNIDGTADAANYSIEPYASFGSQDYARKAVRFERRLELAMEGHRLFDIRRWNNGTDIINTYLTNESRVITSFAGRARSYDSKHNLLPIPLTAIDLSGGIIQQNPGY